MGLAALASGRMRGECRDRERRGRKRSSMQSWPLAGEEPLCVHGGLKKGTQKSPMLPVPSAAGARLAFMQQCQWVESPALGFGWPLICLLPHVATFPVRLSLSPGVMRQLRTKWVPGSRERSRGERLFPGSLRAFSTAGWGGKLLEPLWPRE